MLPHGAFENIIFDISQEFGSMFNSICKEYISIRRKLREIIPEQIDVNEQIGAFESKSASLT